MADQKKIRQEFEMAKQKINRLIINRKYNSSDYDVIGLLDESDALAILDGAIKILRRTLEIIAKDYLINKKNFNIIKNEIVSIKRNVQDELEGIDYILHDYGAYIDKYGVPHEKTYEEASEEFRQEIRQKLETIDIQKLRLENFRVRKAKESRAIWIPIIISGLALMVSILTFIFK